MFFKMLRPAAAAMLFVSATSAYSATTLDPSPGPAPPGVPGAPWSVFDFTVGYNNSGINNVSDGNVRTYTATSAAWGTFNVKVSAWSIETVCTGYKYNGTCYGTTSQVIRDSKLMVYSGGLGVVSGDDDGGSNNQHTIDNEGRKDFLVLQFDKKVDLVAATFNVFSVNNVGYTDSDATIAYANTSLPWTGSSNPNDKTGLGINDQNKSVLDALFNNSYYESPALTSGNNSRYINTANNTGNLWLIGASFNNDRYFDGFKLEALAVVPEPQTWAMMIAGFGLVGGAMRMPRRRSAVQPA